MSGVDVVVLGVLLLAYALLSQRLARAWVTAPMVLVGAGFLVGPQVLDLVELGIGTEDLGRLAEGALALVLFTDASSIDLGRLRREGGMPIRLLGLALPMTILVGGLFALVLFPELFIFEAVALAVLLAPTDAALGQAVVSDRRIPSNVRQGLNVESGLNDGVCVPLLVGALALARIEEASSSDSEILRNLVVELGIAVAMGVALAFVIAHLVRWSHDRGWLEHGWAGLIPLVTALVAYTATTEAGGSGFIAAFVAGLVYGRVLGDEARESIELTEGGGRLLSSVTLVLFGAVLVSSSIERIDLATVVYAVLSLTVVRMVPVAIALRREASPTKLFVGWFGPRGLATIVFVLTLITDSGLPGAMRIVDAATITVLLSVFAHGITAAPLTDRYVRWVGSTSSEPS